MKMNMLLAKAITGGLSNTSKMPCNSFGLPTQHCHTGKKLKDMEGTICNKCYGLRGHYLYPNVQDKLEERYQLLISAYEDGTLRQWVNSMAFLIGIEGRNKFRWHDVGDLQGVWHLDAIVKIAEQTPEVKHWLPTHEPEIVKKYLKHSKHHCFPRNLVVRLSATHFEEEPPIQLAKELGVQVSGASKTGFNCPSSTQGNKCGDCTACWDKRHFNVIYKRH